MDTTRNGKGKQATEDDPEVLTELYENLRSLSITGNPLPLSENRLVIIGALLLGEDTNGYLDRMNKKRKQEIDQYLSSEISVLSDAPPNSSILKQSVKRSKTPGPSKDHKQHSSSDKSPDHGARQKRDVHARPLSAGAAVKAVLVPEGSVYRMFNKVEGALGYRAAKTITADILGHEWSPRESNTDEQGMRKDQNLRHSTSALSETTPTSSEHFGRTANVPATLLPPDEYMNTVKIHLAAQTLEEAARNPASAIPSTAVSPLPTPSFTSPTGFMGAFTSPSTPASLATPMSMHHRDVFGDVVDEVNDEEWNITEETGSDPAVRVAGAICAEQPDGVVVLGQHSSATPSSLSPTRVSALHSASAGELGNMRQSNSGWTQKKRFITTEDLNDTSAVFGTSSALFFQKQVSPGLLEVTQSLEQPQEAEFANLAEAFMNSSSSSSSSSSSLLDASLLPKEGQQKGYLNDSYVVKLEPVPASAARRGNSKADTSSSSSSSSSSPSFPVARPDAKPFMPEPTGPVSTEQLPLRAGYNLIPSRIRQTPNFTTISAEMGSYLLRHPPPEELVEKEMIRMRKGYRDETLLKGATQAGEISMKSDKAVVYSMISSDTSRPSSALHRTANGSAGKDGQRRNAGFSARSASTGRSAAHTGRSTSSVMSTARRVAEVQQTMVPMYMKNISRNMSQQRQLDKKKQYKTKKKNGKGKGKANNAADMKGNGKGESGMDETRNGNDSLKGGNAGSFDREQHSAKADAKAGSGERRESLSSSMAAASNASAASKYRKVPLIYSSQTQGRIRYFGYEPGVTQPTAIRAGVVQKASDDNFFYCDINPAPVPRQGLFPMLTELNGKTITIDELDRAREVTREGVQAKAHLLSPQVFGGVDKVKPPHTRMADGMGLPPSQIIAQHQSYKHFLVESLKKENQLRKRVKHMMLTGQLVDDEGNNQLGDGEKKETWAEKKERELRTLREAKNNSEKSQEGASQQTNGAASSSSSSSSSSSPLKSTTQSESSQPSSSTQPSASPTPSTSPPLQSTSPTPSCSSSSTAQQQQPNNARSSSLADTQSLQSSISNSSTPFVHPPAPVNQPSSAYASSSSSPLHSRSSSAAASQTPQSSSLISPLNISNSTESNKNASLSSSLSASLSSLPQDERIKALQTQLLSTVSQTSNISSLSNSSASNPNTLPLTAPISFTATTTSFPSTPLPPASASFASSSSSSSASDNLLTPSVKQPTSALFSPTPATIHSIERQQLELLRSESESIKMKMQNPKLSPASSLSGSPPSQTGGVASSGGKGGTLYGAARSSPLRMSSSMPSANSSALSTPLRTASRDFGSSLKRRGESGSSFGLKGEKGGNALGNTAGSLGSQSGGTFSGEQSKKWKSPSERGLSRMAKRGEHGNEEGSGKDGNGQNSYGDGNTTENESDFDDTDDDEESESSANREGGGGGKDDEGDGYAAGSSVTTIEGTSVYQNSSNNNSRLPKMLIRLFKQTYAPPKTKLYSLLSPREEALGFSVAPKDTPDSPSEIEGRAKSSDVAVGDQMKKIRSQLESAHDVCLKAIKSQETSYDFLPSESKTKQYVDSQQTEVQPMPTPRVSYDVLKYQPSLSRSALVIPPPRRWRAYDVAQWLGRIGLPQYADTPEFQAMTGFYLVTMPDSEDLRVELNVQNPEHRHHMWQEIAKLKLHPNEPQSIKRSDLTMGVAGTFADGTPAITASLPKNVTISLGDEMWLDFKEQREKSREEDFEIEQRRLRQAKRLAKSTLAVPTAHESAGKDIQKRNFLDRGTFSPALTRSLEFSRAMSSSIFVDSSAIVRRKREDELEFLARQEVRKKADARHQNGLSGVLETAPGEGGRGKQIQSGQMADGSGGSGEDDRMIRPRRQKGADGFWTTDFESVPFDELDEAAEHLEIQNDIDFGSGSNLMLSPAMMKHMVTVDKRHQQMLESRKEWKMHCERVKQIQQNGRINESSSAALAAKKKPVSSVASKAEARLASQRVSVDELSQILEASQKEKIAQQAGEAATVFDKTAASTSGFADEVYRDSMMLLHNIDDPLYRLHHSTVAAQESVKMTNKMVNLGGTFMSYSPVFKQLEEEPIKLPKADSLRVVPRSWVKKFDPSPFGSSSSTSLLGSHSFHSPKSVRSPQSPQSIHPPRTPSPHSILSTPLSKSMR
ncbi:uncharacterized protein MONOS_10319 [Monocercomonoides exilis]|uniref:uncharacterized protein n=1 Tax=Monocercomonoides exilis TaxID=2049356 RepID=UPI00355A85E1|nr:hypothetical protein MONOS_10319 [Monocercomonoides exilis]|eukprot:MONOS_10319.1-p1 / transcript=MONOS_10319.1 / gene=MONOS_10319 / organism=Monocercomonoides_exilis_PA203 / gene_product=unspecified product / transcript_product=unspecified product / location=Mono_scaffold00464:21660-28481(-) / protein_length=2157 / sequence_SO=supercontig / SO=protein_coding / is_pseudo=false